MEVLTTHSDFGEEERTSMSQVVFGELLTLLLNCSAGIFINRILELQSMAKSWSSCDYVCDDIPTKNYLAHPPLQDVKISVKPECIVDSMKAEIAILSTSTPESWLCPELNSDQINITELAESTTSVRNSDLANRFRCSPQKKHSVGIQRTSKQIGFIARRRRLLHKSDEVSIAKIQTDNRQTTLTMAASYGDSCDYADMDDSVEEREQAPEMTSDCDNSFGSTDTAQMQSNRMSFVAKVVRCPICDDELPSKELVRQHVNEQHFSVIEADMRDAETLKLTVAGLNVSCDSSLKAHFDCPDCGLTLTSASSLRRHKMDIHGKDRRQYTCEVCGVSVTSASSLSRHKVLIHNPQRKHVCGDCGRAFAMRQTLDQHVNGVHLKYRPHLCSLCGDRFLKKDNLRNHMRLVHRDK